MSRLRRPGGAQAPDAAASATLPGPGPGATCLTQPELPRGKCQSTSDPRPLLCCRQRSFPGCPLVVSKGRPRTERRRPGPGDLRGRLQPWARFSRPPPRSAVAAPAGDVPRPVHPPELCAARSGTHGGGGQSTDRRPCRRAGAAPRSSSPGCPSDCRSAANPQGKTRARWRSFGADGPGPQPRRAFSPGLRSGGGWALHLLCLGQGLRVFKPLAVCCGDPHPRTQCCPLGSWGLTGGSPSAWGQVFCLKEGDRVRLSTFRASGNASPPLHLLGLVGCAPSSTTFSPPSGSQQGHDVAVRDDVWQRVRTHRPPTQQADTVLSLPSSCGFLPHGSKWLLKPSFHAHVPVTARRSGRS